MPSRPAIKTYAEEQRAQVSKRMAAYWLENAKLLRQVLNRARLWYRVVDDYVTLRNQNLPLGRR